MKANYYLCLILMFIAGGMCYAGIYESRKPIKTYYAETIKIINVSDWEAISKMLLMEDYHLDPIRREIISDFISMNKDKAERIINEKRKG